jgi:hypothetical protein
LSLAQIAKKCNRNRNTVSRYIKKWNGRPIPYLVSGFMLLIKYSKKGGIWLHILWFTYMFSICKMIHKWLYNIFV